MAVVVPIPCENTFLITEDDLGRGYALDRASPLRTKVFKNTSDHTITEKQNYDNTTLKLIRDEESLRNAMGVGGEISLSYGLISGRVLGDYMKESTSSSETLTFLCSRSIRKHILVLSDECPIQPNLAEKVKDLQILRRDYGGYYVNKIQYGAKLDVKITLEFSSKSSLETLKGKLEGALNLGLFSVKVKAHLDKCDETESPSTRVTSEVWLMGAEHMHRTDINNLDEALALIDNFKVDEDTLVPIAMEIAPIPPGKVPLLNFTDVFLEQYVAKVKDIGSQYWAAEELRQQLLAFKMKLTPLESDLTKAIFAQRLLLRVADAIDNLLIKQQESAKFLQNNSIEYIAKYDIPFNDAIMTETAAKIRSLLGKSVLHIPNQGKWQGPAIDGVPIFEGTYEYADGMTYTGLCLDGKRNGRGVLKYGPGNNDKITEIDGTWKDDELTFPSTIKYLDKSPRDLLSPADAAKWRADQRAAQVANSVAIRDLSSEGEYIFRFRVLVHKNLDHEFQTMYNRMLRAKTTDAYYFMFMGMTGAGKTTMVEYFLNVLTGQVHATKTLRAQDLESKNRRPGESSTVKVCCYEIDYVDVDPSGREGLVFRISLVDTPGFGDTGGLEKDQQHAQNILKAVAKLPELHGISYVVAGSLTRTTLDQISTLCNVFSLLPVEALTCVSSIVTFCANTDQASTVRQILEWMLHGIESKPMLHMDNPWAHHVNNAYRVTNGNKHAAACGTIIGDDNTSKLEKNLKKKSGNLIEFIMVHMDNKTSFSPEGMAELGALKADLLSLLKKLGAILKNLDGILVLIKARTENDIQMLVEKAQATTLEQFVKGQGFALINGKAMGKIVGKNPFTAGAHATVCFAPDCTNMKCHVGCGLDFTPKKGDNIFRTCIAFDNSNTCGVCPLKCSFEQHIHTRFQLEWIENDQLADTYYSLKQGAEAAISRLEELQKKAAQYEDDYEQEINQLADLKERFRKLSVFGDMRAILKACESTYQQELTIIRNTSMEEGENPREIKQVALINQLALLIEALDESDQEAENTVMGKIKASLQEGKKKFAYVTHKIGVS